MTTENTAEGGTMSAEEKAAWLDGVRDKMHGYRGAIAACKARSAKGDANCAAYVLGYDGSGV